MFNDRVPPLAAPPLELTRMSAAATSAAPTASQNTAAPVNGDEPAAPAIRVYSRKRGRNGGALKRSPNSGRIRPKFSSKPRARTSAKGLSPDPTSPPLEPAAEAEGDAAKAAQAAAAGGAAASATPQPVTFQMFFGGKQSSQKKAQGQKQKQKAPSGSADGGIVEAVAVQPPAAAKAKARAGGGPKGGAMAAPAPRPKGAGVWPIFKPGGGGGGAAGPAKQAKATSAKRHKGPAAAGGKSKQLLLDVGQKGLAPTTCAVCGMMYSASSEEDRVAHSDFHRKFELGVKFSGWKQETVVRQFDEDTHGRRVISLQCGDRAAHLQKFGQLKEVMDAEMGFVAQAGSKAERGPLREEARETAYIYISESGTALACALVQRIAVGFAVATQADATAAGDSSPDVDKTDSLLCTNTPQPCTMGVKQMWVHRGHRRQGHMTTLLDVIRANYTPGLTVPKERLAFTQTTPDGKQFAISYCGTRSYKIYEASW